MTLESLSKVHHKQEIFDKVHQYYNIFHTLPKFIPGETQIPYSGRVYDQEEIINLVDSALDFWLTAGKYANQFEREFAEFLGVKHCILTNSGSSANLLAMSALTSPLLEDRQLKPRDEVITTAVSFPTTVNPIVQNNLIPVFVDTELGTYNISTKNLESAITPKTKAIFIAHTLGNPFNISKIIKIAEKYKLFLIEDNCDTLGSKYNNQYTGTFGDIATYSFYPPHHITMGEGGALTTNNDLLKKIIESFRDWGRACWCEPGRDNSCGKRFSQKLGDLPYGFDHKYIYSNLGYNLKITDMQAGIGCAQLKKLPSFIEARRNNFKLLYEGLRKYEKYFILPKFNEESSPFGFPLTVYNAPFTRNEIVQYLEDHKISTRLLFAGNITKQPSFKDVNYRIHGDLKNTDIVMNSTFFIGVYPGLTIPMLRYITKTFNNFLKQFEA